MRNRLLVFPFSFLAMVAAGCSDRPSSQIALAAQQVCAIEQQLAVELGATQDPTSIRGMETINVQSLTDGWVVLEEGTNDVISYDLDGRFRTTLGSVGEGPEEFNEPVRLAVDAADSIWISEARQRVVILDPSGQPVRTIIRDGQLPVEGFTPSGLPFSSLAKMLPQEIRGYAQIWSRDGDRTLGVGPGALASAADAPTRWSPTVPPTTRIAALHDTVFVAPGGWNTWLFQWTPHTEKALVRAEDIWIALGLPGEPTRGSGQPIAALSDGNDGLWLIGAIRQVTDDELSELAQKHAAATGYSGTPRHLEYSSPSVRNQAFDGVLLHLNGDGAITHAATFDDHPWGFVNTRHYFTIGQSEIGLMQIRIWRFELRCEPTFRTATVAINQERHHGG